MLRKVLIAASGGPMIHTVISSHEVVSVYSYRIMCAKYVNYGTSNSQEDYGRLI